MSRLGFAVPLTYVMIRAIRFSGSCVPLNSPSLSPGTTGEVENVCIGIWPAGGAGGGGRLCLRIEAGGNGEIIAIL